jgi:DNA ligase-associated metallophosphoesterase
MSVAVQVENAARPDAEIICAGERVQLDPSGVAFLPDHGILVVADLHFEKAASLARRRGLIMPPYDTRETLLRLDQVITRLKPDRVIALGDTWHDTLGATTMKRDDAAQFAALRQRAHWILITGNHDPVLPHTRDAEIADVFRVNALCFRHEPSNHETFEIAGHLHPVAKIKERGRVIRRRCFIANERRLILPAFGAYTGGLNVRDKAYHPYFAHTDYTIRMVGTNRLYAVSPLSLLPD